MTEDKIIKDAQYRKGLSIAFFNATNTAIELVKPLVMDTENVTDEKLQERVVFYRDWLLDEHKKYYSEVIAPVGKLYDSKKTIEALKVAQSKVDLKKIWISLSEDERHDGEILKVVKELKTKLK